MQPTQTPSNFFCLDLNCSHLPISTKRLHMVTLGLSVQSWYLQIDIIGYNGNKYTAVRFQMSKCGLAESSDFTVCNLSAITALTASTERTFTLSINNENKELYSLRLKIFWKSKNRQCQQYQQMHALDIESVQQN